MVAAIFFKTSARLVFRSAAGHVIGGHNSFMLSPTQMAPSKSVLLSHSGRGVAGHGPSSCVLESECAVHLSADLCHR